MTIVESVKTCLTQKFATFEGRAKRSEYWWFWLVCFVIGYIPIVQFLGLILLIPSIAVGVRRMHDVNKSGWWLLCPIYNIILAATEGTQGPNDYGEEPVDTPTGIDQLDK
ncbi:MAG: DUF805 domain-containing protein [Bacteroidaceae bacterium]|nr:DUF805 domain-containing protein [Bacteroidaceae bacterium]